MKLTLSIIAVWLLPFICHCQTKTIDALKRHSGNLGMCIFTPIKETGYSGVGIMARCGTDTLLKGRARDSVRSLMNDFAGKVYPFMKQSGLYLTIVFSDKRHNQVTKTYQVADMKALYNKRRRVLL